MRRSSGGQRLSLRSLVGSSAAGIASSEAASGRIPQKRKASARCPVTSEQNDS